MKKLLLVLSMTVLMSAPAFAEGRPAGCPHAWCGCWLAQHFHISGAAARALWPAIAWAHRFPRTSPRVGAVAVMRHHVGQVTGFDANGNPVILSGNHNHRVGEGVYPKGRIIAYVQP